MRKRRELIWKCNFTVINDELRKKRRGLRKKRRTQLSMPSRSCDPSFITDPFGSVVFYGEVTLWYANPSFFKFSLLRSVVFSVYSSSNSSYKSVRRFFKTHPSFFQNHVHEKILILTTFYGTKTIGEVMESWQCFSWCWHKRNWCNTSSFGCVILNFVNPNIVKNSTFSWLYGQTQLWQALVFDIMDPGGRQKIHLKDMLALLP